MTSPIELELQPAQPDHVEEIWRALEPISDPPYFLSWGWIENWLAMLPRHERPELATLRDAGGVVAAFFVGRRRLMRHFVLPSRAIYVNATGLPERDEICIEHNGVVSPRGAWSLAQLVELLPHDWDELFLPAVDVDRFDEGHLPHGYRMLVQREVASPYVDLARVRAAGDYLELLSPNTRAQIRRASRRVGPTALEVAETVPEALAIYDELVALHGETWRGRGEVGAFADPWFGAFHRRLITRRFAHGEIQLARLVSKTGTVGCLYNFVSNGRVLFYQSGLATLADGAIKPGLLTHAAVIAHAALAGHGVYDLLGGEGRYKRSLATDATRLAWLCVQRTKLRFALEDRVREWRHAAAAR